MQEYWKPHYIILLLIVIFCTLWITLYTFNPYYVQVISECDIYPRPGANPDPIKCYIYSFLIVFIIGIIILSIYIKNNSN